MPSHRILLAFAVLCFCVPATAQAQGGDRAWVQRALALQSALGDDVPLRDAPWVGTHNSFNSVAEMGPTPSAMDSNQQIRLLDQLDEGIRSLELDVHLFPSPRDPRVGGRGPVVCHATPEHAGCSAEKPFAPVLRDLDGWLARNPGQVLLLYLEDKLDTPAGYAAAADDVERTIGPRIFRPPAGGEPCDDLPLDLTRDAIRAAGKQVLIVGNCGMGDAWPAFTFDWGDRHEETRPIGFQDFPGCGPDFDRATYDRTIVRYFEDSTGVNQVGSAAGALTADDGLTPATVAAMTRCGVDLLGLDQVVRDDPRLEAAVWSWAPGEPAGTGDCVVQRADGRWATRPCGERRRVACRAPDGSWSVPRGAVPARAAARLCGAGVHAVPRTGHRNLLLRNAAGAAGIGTGSVWLAHRRAGTGFEPDERAGCAPSVRPGTRPAARRGRVVVRVALRLTCTGETLRRRVTISGGRRAVRTRTGRRATVAVVPGTRALRVEFVFRGRRLTAPLPLAR